MGKSSAPPTPDYTSAAEATGKSNLEAARSTTKANRVNTTTPFGSLNYTNGQTFNQTGYDAAMAKYNAGASTNPAGSTPGVIAGDAGASESTDAGSSTGGAATAGGTAATGGAQGAAPRREDFMTGDPDQWSSSVTLSPDQQKLLDATTKTQLGMAGLQDSGMSRVASALSKQFNVGDAAGLGEVYSPTDSPEAYKRGSSPALSDYYDPMSDTNTATQAILSRVNPQLDRDQASLDTRLANQGLTPGSEAWTTSQTMQGQKSNDARIQAALQGISLGMAQQGQNFNQSVTGAGVDQSQQAQQFGQETQNINTGMAQQAQQFGQQNTLHDKELSDMLLSRQQPLNELNALRTGSQVTMPTFTNAPAMSNPGGTNYSGALNNQYQAMLNGTSVDNANQGSLMSGLGSAAAAILPFMLSDARIKRNVVLVGKTRKGVNIYNYDNLITGTNEFGVLAQEIAVSKPHAVRRRPDGLLEVNYTAALE